MISRRRLREKQEEEEEERKKEEEGKKEKEVVKEGFWELEDVEPIVDTAQVEVGGALEGVCVYIMYI